MCVTATARRALTPINNADPGDDECSKGIVRLVFLVIFRHEVNVFDVMNGEVNASRESSLLIQCL